MAIADRFVTLSPEEIRKTLERDLANPKYVAMIRQGLEDADAYIEGLRAKKTS